MSHHKPDRWKGFVLGAVRGMASAVTLNTYRKATSTLAGGDPPEAKKESEESGPLDDRSLCITT